MAELFEARPQFIVDGREHQLAATGLMRRARFVQRQAVYIGDATQALDPERFELLVIVTEQRRIEPAGVVDVVQRRRLPVQWLAILEGQKRGLQIGEHVLHRPAVGDDVVLGDQQHMLARTEAQQLYTGQLARGEGERPVDFLTHALRHPRFTGL